MHGTIIENWYDKVDDFETAEGESIHFPSTAHVYKETKYGLFYGEVQAAPADEDIANQWDGYRFAELKCDIQAYKAKAKVMKERALGIEHACNVVARALVDQGNDNFMDDAVYQKFERQRQVAWSNYYKAKELYEIMRDSYSGFCSQVIKQRREIRNKY